MAYEGISDFVAVDRAPRRPAPVLKKKRLAFRWYGGKFSHLDWLFCCLSREFNIASRSATRLFYPTAVGAN